MPRSLTYDEAEELIVASASPGLAECAEVRRPR